MADCQNFSIASGSAEPIYLQIVGQIRRQVAGGQLRAGEELPSVRELAKALVVNPMTVSKAFGLLEAEGVLERRRGLAMVVADRPQAGHPVSDPAELLRPTLERAADEARQLQLSAAQAISLFKKIFDERADS